MTLEISPFEIELDDLEDIRRALCFLSTTGAREYKNEFIDHVVLHGLAQLPMGSRSVSNVLEKIRESLKIPLEHEIVMSALWRLVDKEIAYTSADRNDTDPWFGLIPERIKEIKEKVEEQAKHEEQVVNTWLSETSEKHPWLEENDLELLREDLATFSNILYSIHSVESVSIFFGDNSDIQDFISQIDEISMNKILPDRGERINEIRRSVLSDFFYCEDIDRKAYIGSHLNPLFALSMMRLDPKSAKLVSEEFLGGTLILDTNVLFRLFGLDGADIQDATIRLLDLSRGLNYRPVVTPRTIEEYLISIQNRENQGKITQRIPLRVAQTALNISTGRSIDTGLWEKVVETKGRISIDEYFHLFSNIEVLLKQHNIEIYDERDAYIRGQLKSLSEESSKLVQALGWHFYDEKVIEHDAHHRLLILDLRQGFEDASPLETRYWFLTCDSKLVFYDRIVRQSYKEPQRLMVPFCVQTSHWLQILSPYRAAVEGFEIAQVEHLDSPLFRLFHSMKPSVVSNLITRLSQDGFSAEFTAKTIANESFIVEFSDAKSTDEEDRLYEEYTGGEFEKLKEEKDKIEKSLQELFDKVNRLEDDIEVSKLETEIKEQEKNDAEDMVKLLLDEIEEFTEKTKDIDDLRFEYEISKEMIDDLKKTITEMNQRDESKDKIERKMRDNDVGSLYQGKDTPPESSQLIKIINLTEHKLRKAIRETPTNEKEIQDAYESLLIGADIPYSREAERIKYSSKSYQPDFTFEKIGLAIDVKFCGRDGREKEIISEINDDILAYQTKYANVLFIVYDSGFIRDVDRFSQSFEAFEKVIVRVVKH